MSVALVVSRRARWVDVALTTAQRVAAFTVYRHHTDGPYHSAVNDALAEARDLAPVVLKVDDHDEYPDDHAAILDQWQPGVTLYGVCDWVTCDGQTIARKPSLCASAFPSDLTVTGDFSGAITGSVLMQTRVVTVETGVRKRVCSEDWSWSARPPQLGCGAHG